MSSGRSSSRSCAASATIYRELDPDVFGEGAGKARLRARRAHRGDRAGRGETVAVQWLPRVPGASKPCMEPPQLHLALTWFARERLEPRLPDRPADAADARLRALEAAFVESERAAVAARAMEAPRTPDAFVRWFEELRATGPGQGDPLFPWLAQTASLAEMKWFLAQEVAGEAGFDDLLALTQVKMPVQAKLELARNYWDEMGRGRPSAMARPAPLRSRAPRSASTRIPRRPSGNRSRSQSDGGARARSPLRVPLHRSAGRDRADRPRARLRRSIAASRGSVCRRRRGATSPCTRCSI